MGLVGHHGEKGIISCSKCGKGITEGGNYSGAINHCKKCLGRSDPKQILVKNNPIFTKLLKQYESKLNKTEEDKKEIEKLKKYYIFERYENKK